MIEQISVNIADAYSTDFLLCWGSGSNGENNDLP
jgi:hypothetical protein